MVLTDAGLNDFGISEDNNIDTNIANIRTKANELIEGAQEAIDTLKNFQYAEYIPAGIDFNTIDLGKLSTIDLSSNEALYVSMIKLAGDYMPADMEEVKALLDTVKGYDTLDDMFVALINKCDADLTAKEDVAQLLAKIGYTYSNIPTGGDARANIIKEAAKAIFAGAEWAIGVANEKATELVKKIDDTMEVKFQLGVEKGANWEATLNALLDRFIDLTDGLFIKKFDKSKNAIAKLSDIAGEVLPMTSMFSNYAGLEKMNEDFFVKAADGDLGNFLAYFEVKDDAIAGNTPVTKALINASDKIVSSFFPTTVSASTYEASETVQDSFTGYQNDPEIAARNMQDIADRKADLVPCALNLLRESGLELAMKQDACAHDGEKETVPAKEATCTEAGYTEKVVCAICGKVLSESTEIPATGHNMVSGTPVAPTCSAEGYTVYTCANGCGTTEKKDIVPAKGHNLQLVDSKDATCTEAGYKKYACANGCGETKTETINAKGHSWSDWKTTKEATEDEEGSRTRTCSVCGATETQTIGKKSQNFFQRIISTIRGFFQRIINFFKNLF